MIWIWNIICLYIISLNKLFSKLFWTSLSRNRINSKISIPRIFFHKHAQEEFLAFSFKCFDQWIVIRAIGFAWLSDLVCDREIIACTQRKDTRISPSIPGYDPEKSARGGLLLASSRRGDRALLADSNPREDVSARYLHTIRWRGPTAVQESAESGRPVSFSACLPSSSFVRCDASRSSRLRTKAPLCGVPSFRFLLPVPDVEVPNRRGPTGEVTNSDARSREREIAERRRIRGERKVRRFVSNDRAKGAARSRTQQVLLRPTGEPCQRFTASGVSHWYPAEGNRCDDAARYQDRSLLLPSVICCLSNVVVPNQFDKSARRHRLYDIALFLHLSVHIRKLHYLK